MLKRKASKSTAYSTLSTMKGNLSEAGRKGAVTIATNMAGRGTDIILAEIRILKLGA